MQDSRRERPLQQRRPKPCIVRCGNMVSLQQTPLGPKRCITQPTRDASAAMSSREEQRRAHAGLSSESWWPTARSEGTRFEEFRREFG